MVFASVSALLRNIWNIAALSARREWRQHLRTGRRQRLAPSVPSAWQTLGVSRFRKISSTGPATIAAWQRISSRAPGMSIDGGW